MASNLPSAVDTFAEYNDGTNPGQTDFDRLITSHNALQAMVVGLVAAAADLNQLAGLQTLLCKKLALAAIDTGGGVFSWQAPAACFVGPVILDVTTPATAACTVDVGATAVSGTTSSDTLIDGPDVHTAAGMFDNTINAGSNGLNRVRVAAGSWITGSMASGATAGLAGHAYVCYVLA